MSERKERDVAEPSLTPEVQVVTNLVNASEYRGIFDSGFNLADFAQKAEFHGMKGEQLWTDQMLERVMARFRQHIASHETKPEEIDNLLGVLSSKIDVDLNRIRRCFYGITLLHPADGSET